MSWFYQLVFGTLTDKLLGGFDLTFITANF